MPDKKQEILVVDDEKNILLLFKEELEEVGYRVTTAENGEEALIKFRKSRPDLVLLDLKMPGMHGVGVLEKIRELDKTVPVVVVSAHGAGKPVLKSQAEYAIKEKKLDIIEYFTKPVDLDDLTAKIKKIIGPPKN